MSPRQRLILFLVVACTFVGAACSGSDESAGTTVETSADEPTSTTVVETAPPATSAPTTEASPGTTTPETDPSLSEPAPTTEVLTTTSPTTGSSTSEPPATPEEQVAAAIEFFEQQWKECLRTLPDCDTGQVIERRVGEEVSNVQANALRWNQNGYIATNIDGLDYRVDEVDIDDSAGTVVAVVCVTDPVSLAEADGSIVDDEFYSSIVDWELTRGDDGEWQSAKRTTRGEATVGEENNLCA